MKKLVIKLLICGSLGLMTLAADARWQCNVTNSRGQLWVGVGHTRASALGHAMKNCGINSRHARSCHARICYRR
jgi:hypothetical protein